MRIAVSNDHAGLPLKGIVIEHLRRGGHDVVDVGTDTDEPVDFPVMTQRVTDLLADGSVERGVLVCGTGVGAAIAANKVPGIRAAVIHDTHVARQGVQHDDVNVACLGAWIVGRRIAEDALDAYVSATFDGTDDVLRRVAQLADMERAGARRLLRHEPQEPPGGGAVQTST